MYYSGYDDHSSHQDRLEQLLNYSAADGKFSINATVFKRMIKKLKKQGFDVQVVKESDPSMCVINVDWHNAFGGKVPQHVQDYIDRLPGAFYPEERLNHAQQLYIDAARANTKPKD